MRAGNPLTGGIARADRRLVTRFGFAAVALIALGYAPVAFTYMWRYFRPGTVQLQAAVTSAIDGRVYAVGNGSVDWLRAQAYEANRWVMLIHTTFGAICLVLGVVQFLPRIRAHAAFHRWCGRVFLATMTVSMLTAMAFLVLAGSPNFDLAPALWLQLWVLGLATLSTGWLAVAMIRRGDIVAHQGFTMLCLAYLMTAPGLRILWMGLHPLFPHLLLVDNLVGASITETVLAPTLGVMAFLWARPLEGSGPRELVESRDRHLIKVLALAASAVTATHFVAVIPRTVPTALLGTYLVPFLIALIGCDQLATRSQRKGKPFEARRWRMLTWGLLASNAATNATWLIGALVTSQTTAFLASVLVTTGVPITLTGIVIIKDASAAEARDRRPMGRDHPLGGRPRPLWVARTSHLLPMMVEGSARKGGIACRESERSVDASKPRPSCR